MNGERRMRRVLVVDDEPGVRESLRMVLKDGYETVPVASGPEALEVLGGAAFDVILLDIVMPGMDGLQLLEEIRGRHATVPVVMLTATKTVKTAVGAMKLGAFDYITKPFDIDELRVVLDKATQNAALVREVEELRSEVGKRYQLDNIVGRSAPMQEVFKTVLTVAPLKTTILITGESGTGKELVAKAIHFNSPRARRTLVTLNCAAIPENLLESELFGHERGSFTDAHQKKLGQFEMAHEGTLFLDEIGEMGLALQAKLLRVLEHGEFLRVGGTKPIQVDVRIIAATNRNLEAAVQDRSFREDLFYRLNVFPIVVPPLRDRLDDIPGLAWAFIDEFSKSFGKTISSLSQKALAELQRYPWPGNVRELRNVIERAVILATGSQLTIAPFRPAPRALDTVLTLTQLQAEHIRTVLETTNWRVRGRAGAAERLGVKPTTLESRMARLGIARPKGHGPGAYAYS